MQGNQGAFVYVILPDDTVAVRSVKVAARSGDRVAITAGVQVDERVVLEGTDRLRAGAKVRVIGGSEARGGRSSAAGAANDAPAKVLPGVNAATTRP